MTAKEAREHATGVQNSRTAAALKTAKAAIKAAADQGECSAFTYERLTAAAVSLLKSEGFKVREWDEQKDGYGCEITW